MYWLWLQKKLGYVGVYLDGINYDRVAMMRLARMLTQGGSEYYLPFHSGDNFKNPWSERRAAALAQYMEHLPYVTQLMFGEVFWFDGPEGYWMTNLAGLPFGIDNQFYPVPGPDYIVRAMLFALVAERGPVRAGHPGILGSLGHQREHPDAGLLGPRLPRGVPMPPTSTPASTRTRARR